MRTKSVNNASVADLMGVMEQVAPPLLAEQWDNCGLQVGSPQWPVHKVWVALDPLPAVVHAAIQQKVDLIITHHPLLFRPLRSIDVQTPVGRIIESALAAHLALFAAHTNLDSAREGVNDILARVIGLKDVKPMMRASAINAEGKSDPLAGMGRLGRLNKSMTLEALARQVKARLNLPTVKVAGNPRMKVSLVAVCSGSGSSLVENFLDTPAQVFISGDLRYHDARGTEEAGRALIDVGHFSSEHLVIEPLVEKLKIAAQAKGWRILIEPCRLERDPFVVC